LQFKASLESNSSPDPFSKITRTKWTGGVAQAVEYLLCKYKALNLNPSPTKRKKFEASLNYIMRPCLERRKEGWEGKGGEAWGEKRRKETIFCLGYRLYFLLLLGEI
jgi:hypothetical protein